MIIVSSLWLIFLIIVYIILDKLFKKHLAKKSESYNHVMLIEKGFLQFGRIGGLLCAVASICGFVFDQIVIATAMLIFSVIFQFFVCLYYSFSLFYNDKELVYRDFIRYKLMRFDEIISISFDGENLKLSTKNDFFETASIINESFELYKYLRSRCTNLVKNKQPIPKVRKLKDSVNNPFDVYVIWGIFGFFIVVLNAFIIYDAAILPFSAVSSFFLLLYIIVSFFTLKRAHSSRICYRIAEALTNDHFLKPGVENFQGLIYYLEIGRIVVLLFEEKRYLILKSDVDGLFDLFDFFDLFDEKNKDKGIKLFTGDLDELSRYEFSPGITMNEHFEAFDVLRFLKAPKNKD